MKGDIFGRLEKIGADGFVVSVCYGPSGIDGPRYSVNVLAPDGASFDKPFGANDFAHCVEIAEIEIKKRGWIKQ